VPLQYLISFKEANLLVKIVEQNSRRILYWDTLSKLAAPEDFEALHFFRKILTRFSRDLETLSFQFVGVPAPEVFECLRLLARAKRVLYNNVPLALAWQTKAVLKWRGASGDSFSAYLQLGEEKIPLEACERVFPTWALGLGRAFPIESALPWAWTQPFLKGPAVLSGVQKKRFLQEGPAIEWVKSERAPRLFLTDATGCFANLESFEEEKDLLEVGYLKKEVGNSHYFCPSDQARGALQLLLEVGWEIFLSTGQRLYRQTNMHRTFSEEHGAIAVRGTATFQQKTAALRPVFTALQAGKLWVEIDEESVGLLERSEILTGEWVGETLKIDNHRIGELIPLMEARDTSWEEKLLQTLRGLKEAGESEPVFPTPEFQGVLMPHQQKGLNWLMFLYNRGFSGLLADEMGLGKTVQVLAFFSLLETNLPILIVAPASLLYHWQFEIRRFLPKVRTLVHTGAGRTAQAFDAQIVITSYALLRIDEELLQKTEWEVIVLDESNAIKTAETLTAKAACRLQGRFRIALSGTPIENRFEEMVSQFQFLMPGLRTNYKPFILRRKKDELDLPEKIEQIVWVDMDEEQRLFYDSYVQGVQSGLLKKVASDGVSAHRMEILEAILRLRQISSDPRLMGSNLKGAKLERLIMDVEEALSEKRKVLIYSQFSSMLTRIGQELNRPFLYLDGSTPPLERAERVRRFQEDPERSLFLLSLKAGGVGLNLTAADYVFIFDPWWNDAVEQQAIDRAHRIGQKKTVIAKRYITLSTIEEKMMQLKADKKQSADAFFSEGESFSWTEEDLLHLLT
jgi:superfamily II DNA or RNA helicase